MQRSLAGASWPFTPFQVDATYSRAQGGHLASIGSKNVHNFLAELETKVFVFLSSGLFVCHLVEFYRLFLFPQLLKLLKGRQLSQVWVGGNDADTEGDWR